MGVETVSGGTTAPTTGNEVQAFYFRFDTLDGDLTLATKYNIQLNLGVAAAGKADHLLLMIADSDTSTPPVRIVLYQYNNFPEVGALATGDLAAKVANVSGFGVEDTAATGAIGKYDTTNTLHGFEIKIPVDWFGATYGGNFTNVGTGASSVVTAVFTGTGNSLGSVGTIKDTLNNTSGVTTGTNTDTETGDTSFVELEVNKLVITTSAQTLTAGTASAEYTVQTQNDLGARAIVAATGNTNIKMSSDSATGTFSATAGGTYTTTLTQTINVGANSTTFFYKDIVSGSPIITAAEDPAESPDWTNATQPQTVNPATLTSTNVQPESLNNNAEGNVDVSFTTVNPIPVNGKIVVTLPNTFTISSGGTTTLVSDNFDGNTSVTLDVANRIITITRTDGSPTEIAASTAVTLKLSNIKNPSSAGSTGTYSIKTTDSSNSTIDQDTAVSADTIVQDPNQTISDTSSATLSDSFDLGFPRTTTATLSDSFTLGFAQTSTATLASTAQSVTTFSRTSTATLSDTVDLAIPRTSTATLSDSFGLGFPRTSTTTLSDAAQSAATFGRTSTATISDPFDLGIPRTSTATVNDSFDLGLPRTSTSTLTDASQSASVFGRTSTASLNDPAQNAASFGRSSTATLGDTFGLGLPRTSTSTLSDASQSAAAFFRTSTSTLGDSAQNAASFNPTSTVTLNDSFGLGLAQSSTATLGDSFGLGFPRTSTATLGDSFGLGLGQSSTATLGDSFGLGFPRTSTSTLGDTAQNAAGFGRASTATLGDSFGLGLPSTSTTTLGDSFDLGFPRTSTSTLGDSFGLGLPSTSTTTLGDSFGLGLPSTSTTTLGDSFNLGFPRTSTSTLGDFSDLGFPRTSEPTLSDSFSLGFPLTSASTLGDSFSLGSPRISVSTLGDTAQNATSSGRPSTATISDTFSLTHTVIGTLTDTDVQPQSLLASAVGNVDVSFKLDNALPKDGKIVIILPSGFTISSGAATALVSDNFDGGTSVTLNQR